MAKNKKKADRLIDEYWYLKARLAHFAIGKSTKPSDNGL